MKSSMMIQIPYRKNPDFQTTLHRPGLTRPKMAQARTMFAAFGNVTGIKKHAITPTTKLIDQ